MMSDEIDIEEHDLLDNPTIRSIFPDLTVIKKEISQYEEVNNAIEETPSEEAAEIHTRREPTVHQYVESVINNIKSHSIAQKPPKDKRLEVHLRFKTFLDSLSDDISENNDVNCGNQSDAGGIMPSSPINLGTYVKTEPEKKNKPNVTKVQEQRDQPNVINEHEEKHKSSQNNVFLLGSKPNLKQSTVKITYKKQLKVILKNVGPYLNKSKQYCKYCFILFPHVDVMKSHMKKVHSLPTIDRINNDRTNRRKRNYQMEPKYTVTEFDCEICNTTLCSKSSLVRHLKTVHKNHKLNKGFNKKNKTRRSSKVNGIKSETKKSLSENRNTNLAETHNCFHCHLNFNTQSALIEHLYDVLNPSQKASNDLASDKHKENQDTVDKNRHNISNIECCACALKFLTQKELNEHNREIHMNSKSKPNNENGHISRNHLKEAYNAFQGLNDSKLIENIQKTSRLDELLQNNKSCASIKSDVIEEKYYDSKHDHRNSLDHQNDDSCHSVITSEMPAENLSNVINIQKKKAYQCFICSQYLKYLKECSKHMEGHNIKNVFDMDTVVFDAHCKFCDVKDSNDIRSYNQHIFHFHSEKLFKKVHFDDKAFTSILFKCVKCEVFFLSANAANNHIEHEAIFINWRCLDCHRLFKLNDKAMHLKQHLLSKSITEYALCDSALKRVLYKCLKCGVHYSEKEYFIHSATCDLETPNSIYCNTCDILVNRNDMALHEYYHKNKNLQIFDLTLIESDIINNVTSQYKEEKQNPHATSKFALTFCSSCQCFLGNQGQKHKAHKEGRCGVLNPRTCRKCGLTFTPRGYLSHKMLHDKMKNLNMQAFYFYDIKSKKQIRPPMPMYPDCNICEVHFINKDAVRRHVCTRQSFTTCNVCNFKLTETAYKLHLNYHNYKLSSIANTINKNESNTENVITSTTNNNSNIPSIISMKSKIKYKLPYSTLKKKESSSSEMEEDVSVACSTVTSTTSNTNKTVKNLSPQRVLLNITEGDDNTNRSLFLYTCVPCHFSFDMYDEVVKHCHDHYDYKENRSIPKNENINGTSNEYFVTKLKFDPFYFRFDSQIWYKHIFEKLTQEQIEHILEHSKYKFEYRLKMEEIQPGSSSLAPYSTLYKCDICRCYVDPKELYAHASTCSTDKKTYLCSICGLCFSSLSYKDFHVKSHESPSVSASANRIFLYNKPVHKIFIQMMLDSRNKFILYQCRNCEVVVDKLQREIHNCNKAELFKCSYCGLLFYDKDFSTHVIKHEVIKNFQSEQTVVIIFGKVGIKRDNKLKSSFSGKIYDLTFYKCANCGLCYKSRSNIYKHICASKSNESQCPKCYLCFPTKQLDKHFQLHENLLELVYDDFNSNIISFNRDTVEATILSGYQNENVSDKDTNVKSLLNATQTKSELNANMIQKIYKCRCGLHFLEKNNATKHTLNCTPKLKISKQSCFKCDLLFTPGELFNHLLNHHSNKKFKYKYDIINVSEEGKDDKE